MDGVSQQGVMPFDGVCSCVTNAGCALRKALGLTSPYESQKGGQKREQGVFYGALPDRSVLIAIAIANANGDSVGQIGVPENREAALRANIVDDQGDSTCHSPNRLNQISAGMCLVPGLDGLRHWSQISDVARFNRVKGRGTHCRAPMNIGLRRIIQLFAAITATSVVVFTNSTYAAQNIINQEKCLTYSIADKTYQQSVNRLMEVKELDIWRKILTKANRISASNPALDKTVFLDGKCFWEISLYENAPDHILLWNTYHITIDGSAIFRLDIADPDERILIHANPNLNGIKK